jgi:hypothetical protein
MKKTLTFCALNLLFTSALAGTIDLSLNATKDYAGLGHQVLNLEENKPYQFNCKLSPKDIPPAGTIFLDITLCAINQSGNCPFAYSEGHADLKQPVINFKFSPQTEYISKQTNFSVIMQYIPLNGDQHAVAKYQLSCDYS